MTTSYSSLAHNDFRPTQKKISLVTRNNGERDEIPSPKKWLKNCLNNKEKQIFCSKILKIDKWYNFVPASIQLDPGSV